MKVSAAAILSIYLKSSIDITTWLDPTRLDTCIRTWSSW